MEDEYHRSDLFSLLDLSIEFCGVKFDSPFVLAASPSTDDESMVARGFDYGWAGAVLKTTSVEGQDVSLAYPMISGYHFARRKLVGMGNIDLISRHHILEVEKRVISLKKRYPNKVVVGSIMGSRKDDWQILTERLEGAGADMIECSFSCPQGSIGEQSGRMLGQSVEASRMVAEWVKEAARHIPVMIKITPQVADIIAVANVLREAGADAITASNTLPSLMGIDLDSFIPFPNVGGKSTYSGLSGPAIKPLTLRTIAEIARNVDIPISGTGGASTWRDAVEFMAVGAGIVQYCTAVMRYGFGIIDDLKSGLSQFLLRKGFNSPKEITGKALPYIVDHEELPRIKARSRIDQDSCLKCNLCFTACRDGGHEAIEVTADRLPHVDDEKCVGCGLCKVVCPIENCITMKIIE
ncbi:NAD-dependent dihydropyrimidine dehydrogenase subunit PreA [bacterium]|nr:NAD-dependent dihydropyrimidine dehydrogenase subunit PreA [bacterium]